MNAAVRPDLAGCTGGGARKWPNMAVSALYVNLIRELSKVFVSVPSKRRALAGVCRSCRRRMYDGKVNGGVSGVDVSPFW